MKRLTIGLTGGIGTSKSLIADVFRHIGVKVYCSDIRAKELYRKPSVMLQLTDIFGKDIIKNGTVDKVQLADIVFNNKGYLNQLNNLIHPLVKEDFLRWRNSVQDDYVIMESAIIFETGWQDMFDKIICTYVPENLVIQRLLKRDKTTQNKIFERMNNQMNPKMKAEKSDFVIMNDDVQLVVPQIIDIDKQIRSLV